MHGVLMLAAARLPFFHLGALHIGIPIQSFGVLVATGVLIGASLLRRYAEWHGVSDEHVRGLTGWITICGFLGAHFIDAVFYDWPRLMADPLLIIKLWDGISSFGGFIGGALGFAIYVWWKRLSPRLFGDIGIVGLLPAFSIGRIGCTVVSDHIGAAVDKSAWYAGLAMDYPREFSQALADRYPGTDPVIHAWNLGLVELLYLIPVNALILWLAFRRKQQPAGLLLVLTGMLYAPVRFFLEFLRPSDSDPRYVGLTFAQWAAMAAFAISVAVTIRILRNGTPAAVIAPTAGEAQRQLKKLDADDDEADKAEAAAGTGSAKSAKSSKKR